MSRPKFASPLSCWLTFILITQSGCDATSPVEQRPGSFALSPASPALTVTAGASGTTTLNVVRSGSFSGAVTLTVEGAPAGVTAVFQPATITADATASVLTVTVAAGTTAGSSTLTVRGTAAGLPENTATLALTVVQGGSFDLSVAPNTLNLLQGGAPETLTVNVTRTGGFTGPVTVTLDGLPANAVGSPVTISSEQTTGKILVAAHSAATGSSTVTVRASAVGVGVRTTDATVAVLSAFRLGPEQFWLCDVEDLGASGFRCDFRVRTMADYNLPALASYTVRTSGISHFDPAQRVAELQSSAPEKVAAACIWYSGSRGEPTPPPSVYDGTVAGHTDMWRRTSNDLINEAGQWLGLRDTAAAAYVVRTLRSVAGAASFLGIDRQTGRWYEAKEFASVVLNAFASIRDYPGLTSSDRTVIGDYVARLMERMDFLEGEVLGFSTPSGLDAHNHGWYKDVSVTLWGVSQGNDALFRRGVSRYVSVLAGHVLPDGAILHEATRGGAALAYSSLAIGHIIRIAEAAAAQGHDLYGINVNGMDVHRLVEFFVSAMENESVIRSYAQRQLNCSPEACASWNTQDRSSLNGEWNIAGWVEPYMRRFPGSALTARLATQFPSATLRTMVSDSWGNATCQARRL